MKGINILLASVAGLAGATVAVVGGFLIASSSAFMTTALSGVILVIGLGIIALGVLSIRN